MRGGTYAINLVQFVVLCEQRVYTLSLSRDNPSRCAQAEIIASAAGSSPVISKTPTTLVGIVTVHDGPSLPQGEIIAPIVGDDPAQEETYHNNFQDPDRFLRAGGQRGRQYQVLVEGTYYINRLFATVEMIPKTIIEVGTVGVVVSSKAKWAMTCRRRISPRREGHRGQRGVWIEPLMPGKYAFNTYAGTSDPVHTTNII